MQRGLRLFQLFGTDFHLHWSWILAGVFFLSLERPRPYDNGAWRAVELLGFFLLVLGHELGHLLALRAVKGEASSIVLWPLGGVHSVEIPAKPWPTICHAAGGPLANLLLAGLLLPFHEWGKRAGWEVEWPDLFQFLTMMTVLNFILLGVNLIPIYPLDGGQILRGFLWAFVGRWQSLVGVSLLGFLASIAMFVGSLAAMVIFAGRVESTSVFILTGVLALFLSFRSLSELQSARSFLAVESLPRHGSFVCPGCRTHPPRGSFWVCDECGARFDLFETRGKCPGCGAWYLSPSCPHCEEKAHIEAWSRSANEGSSWSDSPDYSGHRK
ncbi:MAG: site-2 protease family protein [Gemmataceae bacterium]